MKNAEFNRLVDEIYHERNPKGIKSDFGRVLIIGGSHRYPFAPVIATEFAQLSSNAIQALSVPENVYAIAASRAPLRTVFVPLHGSRDSFSFGNTEEERENNFKAINQFDCILFGNGVSINEENSRFLRDLISSFKGRNLVIDASGLRILASDPDMLLGKNVGTEVILTPHLGEANALFGTESRSRDPKHYVADARNFAIKYRCGILLKSYSSIFVSKDNTSHSTYSPTPSLAKAGSGDALAGLMSGLLSFADKKAGRINTVLFADELLHRAAKNAQESVKSNLASIDDCKAEITRIVAK